MSPFGPLALCQSPKFFYFLIWNYTLLKQLLRKNFAIWTKDDFFRIFQKRSNLPAFWHIICLSLLSEYDVIWRTLRKTWPYPQENIKSSDRFFFFRKTFFLRRHCDSILTCNLSFLCSGAGVPQKCRLQKLVEKSRFVQTAKFFRRSYFKKV